LTKRILVKNQLALLLLLLPSLAPAQTPAQYWQQQVNYSIEVSLNDKDHSLTGFEKLEYTNHSPDTLHFIWFHLWPNAYKTDRTAFSDQLLENGNTRFYFSDPEQKGYINRLDFKVDNITAQTEDHPQFIDIVKLILPTPLAPGQTALITTPVHVKLPYNFSRGGHDGQSYQATQWYPKPAVYDRNGWHPLPYLDQGEFYSEFGNFDVKIALPANYVVAATGELQDAEEKQWLNTRANFSWSPIKRKEKNKSGQLRTITQLFPTSSTDIKILHYRQDNIHDFAWFADKRFIVNHDTCRLASGRIVDVYSFYIPAESSTWKNAARYARQALHHYSSLVGEYPYNIASVVQGPNSFGGGMEYPTITVISPTASARDLDNTIAHEIGHNWFYGILGTNERTYPWMDEGLNTYYDNLYDASKYTGHSYLEQNQFEIRAANHTDQPINTSSEKFSETNYNLIAYYKTGEWMRYLASLIGTDTLNRAMQAYFNQWKFKHPQPADFKSAIEQSSGRHLDSAFALLDKKGLLPNQQRTKGTDFVFALSGDAINPRHRFNKKGFLFLFPFGLGFNSYDKLMWGPVISNIRLPFPSASNRLQFLLAPTYAFGSKRFTGTGFIKYSFYPDGIFRKVELGLSAATFSQNEFLKIDGERLNFAMTKLAPGFRLTLRQQSPRSTIERYIQWKTFFFTEEKYDKVKFDTLINTPDTTIRQQVTTVSPSRYLNQLKLVAEDHRALYPYRAELTIDQGKEFIRAGFTGNYFFNYAKAGGLSLRFFAGKFIYLVPKTGAAALTTDRYQLNLTGANGYEDYTYSDYFIGRNKFKGMASQQIMERDGAFKTRTDLLGNKVGKTDDWLMTLNLSTTLPKEINPLNILPIKIPLKIFADVGTYADAWKKNSQLDHFVFEAGLHIPLLKETVNIYIPLVYTGPLKEYIQSYLLKKDRFWQKISFSIDLSHFSFKKFDRNFEF
jgi:hypothetical protein